MVKIKLSPSKKRYLKGKHVYDYVRAHLPVPHRLLKRLEPYFEVDFQVEITEDDSKIALTYTYSKKAKDQNQAPDKTLRSPENPSSKLAKKPTKPSHPT